MADLLVSSNVFVSSVALSGFHFLFQIKQEELPTHTGISPDFTKDETVSLETELNVDMKQVKDGEDSAKIENEEEKVPQTDSQTYKSVAGADVRESSTDIPMETLMPRKNLESEKSGGQTDVGNSGLYDLVEEDESVAHVPETRRNLVPGQDGDKMENDESEFLQPEKDLVKTVQDINENSVPDEEVLAGKLADRNLADDDDYELPWAMYRDLTKAERASDAEDEFSADDETSFDGELCIFIKFFLMGKSVFFVIYQNRPPINPFYSFYIFIFDVLGPPGTGNIPELYEYLGSLDDGDTELESKGIPLSLFENEQQIDMHRSIEHTKLEMAEEEIGWYLEEFEKHVEEEVLMIGNIGLGEVQVKINVFVLRERI